MMDAPDEPVIDSADAAAAPAGPDGPLVARGARFEGLVAFRGDARVDGEVEGRILGGGTLLVGPEARVRAGVEAHEVVVAGSVEGDITAPGRLAVLAGGRVAGAVRTGRLSLADGSLLDGRCETLGDLA